MKTTFKVNVTAGSISGGAKFVPYIKKHLRSARRLLPTRLESLEILFLNDRDMRQLHTQFMGLCSTTDVLTFPMDLDQRGRPTSGEIAVCIPEARRRAREHKVPLDKELLLYALHGMLHLSGFDDKTPRGFSRMHRAEDRLLTQIGVGKVFNRDVHVKPVRSVKRPNQPRGSKKRGERQ